MKIKNILVMTGIFCILLVGSYFIQTTYAKYRKNLSGNVNMSIASWNISVNNESILNKATLNNTIRPVFPGSEYIDPNVVAPGATGYYDVLISGGSTNVAFDYTITSIVDSSSTITDLITTGYSINPIGNDTPIPYNNTTGITGTYNLGDAPTTIRIYITWDDNGSMDNISDTQAATNTTSTALMKCNITFNQKNS